MQKHESNGFTLIELSIVLVIIGLVIAGIVIGQSMIRASKVQTIITDVATYQNAISQFKQKYNELPGDMADATNYWGTNPNCSTGGLGTGTQTCNGDGSGQINVNLLIAPFEQFLVWQHLANAGLISGQYTGTSWPGVGLYHALYCNPGGNCPAGKISQLQSYYLAYAKTGSAGLFGSTTNYWAQPPGHFIVVGASTGNTGYPAYPLLSASEAKSLDAKVDDGMPGQGLWKSFEATGGAGYLPNCVVQSGTSNPPSNGTVASEATAVYNTAYGTAAACSLDVMLNF